MRRSAQQRVPRTRSSIAVNFSADVDAELRPDGSNVVVDGPGRPGWSARVEDLWFSSCQECRLLAWCRLQMEGHGSEQALGDEPLTAFCCTAARRTSYGTLQKEIQQQRCRDPWWTTHTTRLLSNLVKRAVTIWCRPSPQQRWI